jgi:hypothetical protein
MNPSWCTTARQSGYGAPFEAWMLDCVGSPGVERLKPAHRRHIRGVIGYCRKVFEQQVPFDTRADQTAVIREHTTNESIHQLRGMLSKLDPKLFPPSQQRADVEGLR